jgi:hypothetical protein
VRSRREWEQLRLEIRREYDDLRAEMLLREPSLSAEPVETDTWRLETASLPRVAGLPAKAEVLSMIMLPPPEGMAPASHATGGGRAAILLMYVMTSDDLR